MRKSLLIAAVVLSVTTFLTACSGSAIVPPPLLPTVALTPTPTFTPTPVPNPPVRIVLRGVSATRSHEKQDNAVTLIGGLIGRWTPEDDFRLLIKVQNGNQTEQYVFPPPPSDALQVMPGVRYAVEKTMFTTPEIGDVLYLEVVAVEETNTDWVRSASQAAAAAGPEGAVAAVIGPAAAEILIKESEPVGFFQGRWTKLESWGSGRYVQVGEQDLVLWFDIEVGGQTGPEIVGKQVLPTPKAAQATPTARPTATPSPTPTARASPSPTPTRVPPTSTPTRVPPIATATIPPIQPVIVFSPTPTRAVPTPTRPPTQTPVSVPTTAPSTPTPASYGLLDIRWTDATLTGELKAVTRGTEVVMLTEIFPATSDSTIPVSIYEVDPDGDNDLVTTGTMQCVPIPNGTRCTARWKTVWMEDGLLGFGGDPEYSFKVFGVLSSDLQVK